MARPFPRKSGACERSPDRIYLNGAEFGIPIWFFNAEEICSWLSAAEQTQEPVLKDWWSIAKGGAVAHAVTVNRLQNALSSIDQLLTDLAGLKRKSAGSYCDAICGHLAGSGIDVGTFEALFVGHKQKDQYNTEVVANQAGIASAADALRTAVKGQIVASSTTDEQGIRTANSPLFIPRQTLTDPSLINRAVSKEDAFRVEVHLTTLKLRLNPRLDDRRWRAFLNYEDSAIDVRDPPAGSRGSALAAKPARRYRSSICRCSVTKCCLILPLFVVGRILLEARECLPAARRYKHPWVLVLEEAHNYARPARADEDRGHKLARLAYERIAKEGRKFGLSLIIASQRPSRRSVPTIISQCANFYPPPPEPGRYRPLPPHHSDAGPAPPGSGDDPWVRGSDRVRKCGSSSDPCWLRPTGPRPV